MDAHETVNNLAERAWQYRLSNDAYQQVRQRIPVEHIRAGTLDDVEADAAFARRLRTELDQVDEQAVSHEDWLTLAFLRESLQQQVDGPAQWWANFPVTPYQLYPLNVMAQVVLAPFGFETAADSGRYLALLEDYRRAVAGLVTRLESQAAQGWRVPRPALPGVRRTLEGIRAGVAPTLAVSAARTAKLDASAGAQAQSGAERKVAEILAAFEGVLAYLGPEYEALAPDTVGVCQYPGGEEAYRLLVRFNVTDNVDPHQIHQTGLEQVALLTEEMRLVRESVGFSGDEDAFLSELKASGKLYAKSPEEVEARFRRAVSRIEPFLSSYFSKLPNAPYDVRRLDPALEPGMSYGYYEPPRPGEPAGIYYYNGSGLQTRSQLNALALIYHELVPGHHFHIARQNENQTLPAIRREAIEMGAFNEGWAEYASGLPVEMGLYEDPLDLYGRLVHQRFTAQRLVVDTGMNLMGWSLDKARAYMRRYTLESETQVASETLRYSTDLPGQALCYRYGCLKMLALRRKCEEALGPKFDIRAFHEAVLAPGALPLSVLEQHIDHFIREAAAA